MRNYSTFLVVLLIGSFPLFAQLPTYQVEYGGDAANLGNTVYFGDSAGNTFESGEAVVAIGFFNQDVYAQGYDFEANFTSGADIAAGFTELGSTSTFLAPGFVSTDTTTIDTTFLGYEGEAFSILVLGGVSEFSSASSATEFAVVGSSAWPTIGGSTDPIDNLRTGLTSFDQIVFSGGNPDSIYDGGEFSGFLLGGQLIQTAALGAVPEPSQIAFLFGIVSILYLYIRRKKD